MHQSLAERANAAAAVAATHADAVDMDARFPIEAITALRELDLLGILVPRNRGGAGASLTETALICRTLGRTCSSTALIYAMHQTQVASLIYGAANSEWPNDFLHRLARDRLLLASVTSEVGVGGDIRTSICAPDYKEDRLTLTKRSSAISYGDHADALLVTARRTREAAPSDQVLVVAENDDVCLTETGSWNTLGMRGTGSKAFDITLTVAADQVLPVRFGDIAQNAMLPASHLLWGAAWLGIAVDAAEKARLSLRKQANRNPNSVSHGALRFEKVASLIANIKARLDMTTTEYEHRQQDDRDALPLGLLTEVNGLKIMVSEAALEVVQHAMMICGFAGYQYGTPYSLGRQLRDIQSAPLMVNNDQISGNIVTMLIAQRSSLMRD